MRHPTALPILSILVFAPALAGYQAGMEAFRKRDLDTAVREFSVEVEKRPWFDYGHYMIGLCHLGRKNHERAIASFRKAIELEGSRLDYRASLAQAYSELRQWDRLVESLEGRSDLEAPPEVSVQAHFLLGFGYLNQKQYVKAAQELEAAGRLEPDSFRILSPLGIARFLSGDFEGAIGGLQAALRINPGHLETQRYLAEAYLAQAQREAAPPAAEELYQSAALSAEALLKVRGTDDFDAVYLLARARLGAKQYPEALQALDRALALRPDHGFALFNRGQAHRGMKDWPRAERAYHRAVELMPQSADAHAALAFTYEQLAALDGGVSLEKALASYRRARALNDAPETLAALTRVQHNINIRSEAAAETPPPAPPAR